MHRQHIVVLTADERQRLRELVTVGTAPARRQTRARVLLAADTAQRTPRRTDSQIAEMVGVSARTVARVRAQWVEGGYARAVVRQAPQRVYRRRLDAAGEAEVLALVQSTPPPGRSRWSLRLLANRLVALEIVEGIAPNTVRTVLKKTIGSRG